MLSGIMSVTTNRASTAKRLDGLSLGDKTRLAKTTRDLNEQMFFAKSPITEVRAALMENRHIHPKVQLFAIDEESSALLCLLSANESVSKEMKDKIHQRYLRDMARCIDDNVSSLLASGHEDALRTLLRTSTAFMNEEQLFLRKSMR
jgi:hypothetical protein